MKFMKMKHTILSIALLCGIAATSIQAASVIQPVVDKATSLASNAASYASAATSQVASTVASATNAVTSINQAVISILMSGKAVGSDIYSASKEAIHNSIDFVSAQVPDVIRQFLMWRFAEAALNATLWLFAFITIWYLAYRISKHSKSESNQCRGGDLCSQQTFEQAWAWILRAVSFAPLGLGVFPQLLIMAKIYIAPKIYLLDYVVTLVQNHAQ